MKHSAAGFSLLELAVVIAILVVLATILVPVVHTTAARARSAACLGHLRSLGSALSHYIGEHNMMFPTMAAGRNSREEEIPVLDVVLANYVDDVAVFTCPADTDNLAAKSGTSYYYNSVISGQSLVALNFLGLTEEATRIPVLVDKDGWHRGAGKPVNHLFADGHASAELRLFAE